MILFLEYLYILMLQASLISSPLYWWCSWSTAICRIVFRHCIILEDVCCIVSKPACLWLHSRKWKTRLIYVIRLLFEDYYQYLLSTGGYLSYPRNWRFFCFLCNSCLFDKNFRLEQKHWRFFCFLCYIVVCLIKTSSGAV